jgi:DNA-binding HxlR family transcriptional regulator
MDPDRIYRHWCMTARALEAVGDRWSLLIVRDLLLGPRRFTDLVRTLNEITPTRLTSRLRLLEGAGVVVREPGTGREVWYRLTDAGLALQPSIDALTLWAIEHAREAPRPGEPVHPTPALLGTKVWLNQYGAQPGRPVTWVWRFPGEDDYALHFDGAAWELARGNGAGAVVTVTTSPEAWAVFITTPRESRRLPLEEIQLEGKRADVRRFAKAFRAELAPS